MAGSSSVQKDIAIAGGGLAGLSLAILMARKGFSVALVEKDEYPRQKVCGEFISEESRPFLEKLGFYPEIYGLPLIKRFRLSSATGQQATCKLKMGAIGLSRYFLDHSLAEMANREGVSIFTRQKIKQLSFENETANGGKIVTKNQTEFKAPLVVDARGRMAMNDKNAAHSAPFIGIKYHVELAHPADLIEIHGFAGGYCGLSKVENNHYCLCYLTKSEPLKPFKGNFESFEQEIPGKNPLLRRRIQEAKKVGGPFTTSQFYFGRLEPFANGIPAIGDAGGFIPPITGNGMSLAFRSANFLAPLLAQYLENQLSMTELQKTYRRFHQQTIGRHIQKGKHLQNLFMSDHPAVHKVLFAGLNNIPGFMRMMTSQAFGKPIQ